MRNKTIALCNLGVRVERPTVFNQWHVLWVIGTLGSLLVQLTNFNTKYECGTDVMYSGVPFARMEHFVGHMCRYAVAL
jgi:hypothetical protein